MKHLNSTPMTPAEWTVERLGRWERLNKQQRSGHPTSQQFLPLFKQYADGEPGNMTELISDGTSSRPVPLALPKESDGPEEFGLPEPAASTVTGAMRTDDGSERRRTMA